MCSDAIWFSNGCLLHQGKANVLALVPSPSHVPGISLSFSKCTAQRMSFWQTPQVWSWVRATREAIPSSRPALGWWEWSPNITSLSQWSTFSVRSSMMSLRSLMVSKSNCALLKIAQTGFKTPGVYDATSQLGLSRFPHKVFPYHRNSSTMEADELYEQPCSCYSLDLLQHPFFNLATTQS